MPKLTVDGKTVDTAEGKRLVLAIEEDGDVNIGHRCGGYAKCTTCRVEFEAGEPETYTEAEYTKLKNVEKLGEIRLSCQILANADMQVKPLMTLENQEWEDTGPAPETHVTPEAKWYTKEELEARA